MTKVDDLISYASLELGKPYVWGDEGPNTFDCSGLMQWVYAHVGIKLPRTAAQQQRYVTPVQGNPLPGDLIFWGNPAHHVALYLGNGRMISAPHTGATVRISDVYGAPTYGRVPGLGAALAIPVGIIGAGASSAGAIVTSLLGGAKTITLEGLFLVLGLGLIGVGVYQTVASPQIKSKLNTLGGALS
jgi:hypothetical protein